MLLGKIQPDGTRKVEQNDHLCNMHGLFLLYLFSISSPPPLPPPPSFQPGCIDKFHTDTSSVISFVAGEAEAMGLSEDAVRLYDLAKVSHY